jgi:hypothetical protein
MKLHRPENSKSHFIIWCIITKRAAKDLCSPKIRFTLYCCRNLPTWLRTEFFTTSADYSKINSVLNLKRNGNVYNVHLIGAGAFGRMKCK